MSQKLSPTLASYLSRRCSFCQGEPCFFGCSAVFFGCTVHHFPLNIKEFYLTSLYTDPSLVAYYRLENTTNNLGNPTYDLTNHGSTLFNAAVFNNGADGGVGNTTKYLNVNSDLGISSNADISISFWMKAHTNPPIGQLYGLVLHNSSIGEHYFYSYLYNPAGTTYLYIDCSGSGAWDSSIDFTTKFHHIVITRDTTNGIGTLYVNGAYLASCSIGGATPLNMDDFSLFGHGGSEFASVILDDISVFSRVLDLTDVNKIYHGL